MRRHVTGVTSLSCLRPCTSTWRIRTPGSYRVPRAARNFFFIAEKTLLCASNGFIIDAAETLNFDAPTPQPTMENANRTPRKRQPTRCHCILILSQPPLRLSSTLLLALLGARGGAPLLRSFRGLMGAASRTFLVSDPNARRIKQRTVLVPPPFRLRRA